MIASNFVPGLNVVGKAAKAARTTYKLASKSYKAVGKVTTNAKRVAGRALHAPKTVGVKSYRTTKKIAGTVKTKVQKFFTRKSTAKTPDSSIASQRNAKTEPRYVKNERKTESTTQGADEVAATSELGAKGSSTVKLLPSSKVHDAIGKLNANKIHHIINGSKKSNHQWNKLVPDRSWKKIKPIITEVMQNGADIPYKSVSSKVKMVNGELVQVTYRILPDGSYRISDAWVK